MAKITYLYGEITERNMMINRDIEASRHRDRDRDIFTEGEGRKKKKQGEQEEQKVEQDLPKTSWHYLPISAFLSNCFNLKSLTDLFDYQYYPAV